MATFRRHGAGWQAQIIRKGYPARYRTFDTKEAAQKWAVQIEADMTKGVYKDPTTALNTTLGDALDRYQREISVRKKGARQEASRIRTWKNSELAKKSLARLETADFESHIDRRRAEGKAENTIRQEIAIVSNLFKKARKKWRMSGLENPMKELEWPGGSKQRSRRLSADEIDALVEAYPHGEFGAVLELLCETAMRRSELLNADWSQVDLSARVIHLPDTKNGRSRDVPLSKRAVELLARRPSRTGRVFSIRPDSMTQAFGRARSRGRANYIRRCASEGKTPDPKFLVDVRLHDGRHEGTSRLSEKGFNLIEIASVSGHEDMRMVKRYTHPVAGDLARRMDMEPSTNTSGPPPRPADVLRRHLPPRKTIEQAAAWFEIPAETLQGLIDGVVSIDVPLAIQLEHLGPSAETWLNVQSAHDLWLQRHPSEPQPHVLGPETSATLMKGGA